MTIHISQFSTTIWSPLGEIPTPPTPPTANTFRFDSGNQRVDWWIAAQITDSGEELRDKTIRAFKATGKMTLPKFIIYGWGPQQGIDVSLIEAGTNGKTRAIPIPTTELVTQAARTQVNVPNVTLWTWRLQGSWDGETDAVRDRIDETVTEVSIMGIRR